MFILSKVVALLAAAGSAFAVPITQGGSAAFDLNDLGVKFDKRGNSMPTLTLPYGTWRAANYDSNGDVWRTLQYSLFPLAGLSLTLSVHRSTRSRTSASGLLLLAQIDGVNRSLQKRIQLSRMAHMG